MESLEIINRRLGENYGKYLDGKPLFRVVWSEDEIEKRLSNHNAFGIELLVPIVIEVPKYRQYIQNKWILERLVEVPIINKEEVLNNLSYEPIWVFENGKGEALPYRWDVIAIVINQLYKASAESVGVKYRDPRADVKTPEDFRQFQEEELKTLQDMLFGNETEVSDALTYKEGIVVPHSYQSTQVKESK